jgi:hypothetical protein
MKAKKNVELALSVAVSAGFLLHASGCTWGSVGDATNTNIALGHATISYRTLDLSASGWGSPPIQTPAGFATTWANADPGSGNQQGLFYLNPYGTRNPGDTTVTFAGSGWMRATVSQPGYDTRKFYVNNVFSSCDVPRAQGLYSAGPYPFNDLGATISGACAVNAFGLYPSNVDHTLNPDMIVDIRTLRDNLVANGPDCDGLASRCLRASVGTANVGDGDLWLTGNSNSPGVTQRQFQRSGAIVDTPLPNAAFVYHPSHGHIHLQNWTNLRLRQVQPNCNTEATASNCPAVGLTGEKISYCLTESFTFDASYTPNPARAKSCAWDSTTGAINQGIGAGMEDVYTKDLPDQLVGIDGVAPGTYWFEVEVNPPNDNGERTVNESDYTNNIARIQVKL